MKRDQPTNQPLPFMASSSFLTAKHDTVLPETLYLHLCYVRWHAYAWQQNMYLLKIGSSQTVAHFNGSG